jgi:hypothetical protein
MSVVNNFMTAHIQKCESLAEFYLGKAALLHGRSISDPWGKRMWYLGQLVYLGQMIGSRQSCMYRCRRTDTPTYQKYAKAVQDLELVVEHIKLEILELMR